MKQDIFIRAKKNFPTFQLSNFPTKLKASALFYAIIVSMLLALMAGFLILNFFNNQRLLVDYTESERLRVNAVSGLNLLMAKQNYVEFEQKRIIDLYNSGLDSVQLERRSWGGLELLVSKAFSKHGSNQKMALIGSKLSNATALYLADNDKPLSLCGNTSIKGTCYLPDAEVKRAYIEGQSFSGNRLIDGSIRKSEKALPKLNAELVKRITERFSRNTSYNDSIIDLSRQEIKDTIENSFFNKTLLVYSSESVVLNNRVIKGNVILFSDKTITMNQSNQIEDIVVYAQDIIINENFEGSLQAFASDSIQVKKGVKLKYPTFLGIVKPTTNITSGKIFIGEGTNVIGDIFTWQENQNNISQATPIIIDKNTHINGNLYSNTYVDLKGSVYGSVTCQKIMLKTPSSVYENYLLDATIDITKLSEHYAGIDMVSAGKQKKEIVKWIF